MLKIIADQGLAQRILLSAILMLSTLTTPVFAQSDDEAAAIKIGDSNFIPIARFEYIQTNNAFLTPDQPTEATAFVIKPRANWIADRRLLTLTAIYEGEYASYSETALNYADHSLRAIVDAKLSSRKRLLGRVALDFDHQSLGTGFTLGDSNKDTQQVEYLNTELFGAYTYGAAQARGNLQVGISTNIRSFQNQSALTSGLSYTSLRPFGQLSLRLSPDTRAIATLRFTNITYDNSDLDRNGISLLTGLSFDATGKLGGEIQLGGIFSDFSKENRDDQVTFIAEAELVFEPTTFSRFELSASRVLDNDAANVGTVVETTDTAKLRWQHDWSSRLFHVADLSYEVENGDCPVSGIAEAGGGIEMNLVLSRWLHVGASFKGQSRVPTRCSNAEETDVDLGYESQIVGAHIRATL